jgi:hypothetical protein
MYAENKQTQHAELSECDERMYENDEYKTTMSYVFVTSNG